jgi:hypothetical protein
MTHVATERELFKLRIRGIDVRYFLQEPSPDKWNAVGIVGGEFISTVPGRSDQPQLIVGQGRCGDEAVGDLIARVLSEHLDREQGAPCTDDALVESALHGQY